MRGILQAFRPTLGLSLDREGGHLVGVTRPWRHKVVRTRLLGEAPLPPGALVLSPTSPNIAEPEPVLQALRQLRPRGRGLLPVTLTVPDLCGQATVFELSSLPPQPADQEALIQWRVKTELGIPVERTRLVYHFYKPGKLTHRDQPGPAVWALVGAIDQEIVEQYEKICLEAGLLPVSTGLASLALFDWAQARLETIRASLPALAQDPSTSFLVHLAPWGLTILAREQQCPTFLRTKALMPQTQQGENTDQAVGRDPDFSPLVTREVVSTIQYYDRRLRANTKHGCPPYVVYVFTTGTHNDPNDDLAQALPRHLETGAPTSDAGVVIPVAPDRLWPDPRTAAQASAYLCALAGVQTA